VPTQFQQIIDTKDGIFENTVTMPDFIKLSTAFADEKARIEALSTFISYDVKPASISNLRAMIG
jgi:hypothetical protein